MHSTEKGERERGRQIDFSEISQTQKKKLTCSCGLRAKSGRGGNFATT